MEPDGGSVKRRKELEFSYFDQKRKDLNEDLTLWKTLCPDGGDYVDVMGKPRHVCGYLKDFLFDPARVHDKVKTLSGGQKNRLMLAKILANPKSCLILDEPTNDLDMDTMDMLEDILSRYQGTLIIVSHDRDFLDQTVSKILAFEGNGKVDGVIGGYSDYLEMVKKREAETLEETVATPVKKTAVPVVETPKPMPAVKLSYKLQYELDTLPVRMEEIEREMEELEALLADPGFYTRDEKGFVTASRQLDALKKELSEAETRWLELEELRAGAA
jgi:ATP-binding cassette subfamily F protein uup